MEEAGHAFGEGAVEVGVSGMVRAAGRVGVTATIGAEDRASIEAGVLLGAEKGLEEEIVLRGDELMGIEMG